MKSFLVVSTLAAQINYNPLTGVYQGLLIDRATFTTVGIKITNRCNLDCYHCARYGGEDFPYENATMVLDRLANGNVARINFTGGEPLIFNGLENVLRYASRLVLPSRKKFSLSITTNGVKLDQDKAQMLSEYLDSIKISLFALGSNYGVVTGNNYGAYDSAIAGIRNAISAGLPVHAQTGVLKENHDYLVQMASLLDGLGVAKFTIYSNIEQAKGRTLPVAKRFLEEELRRAFDKLLEEKHKRSWNLKIDWRKWPLEGQYILIFSNGDITANPVDNPPQNFEHVGNLLEETVETLWQRYPNKQSHISFYLNR